MVQSAPGASLLELSHSSPGACLLCAGALLSPSSPEGTRKLSGLRFLNRLCMLVLLMGNPGASMSQAAQDFG